MKTNQLFSTRYKSHHNSTGAFGAPKRVSEDNFLSLLNEKPKDIPRALYVHTPYCDKICSFCNLNREQLKSDIEHYSDYLISEFNRYGKYRYFSEKGFDAIYFGGGTPTVYTPKQLENILLALNNNIKFNQDYEFTFETTLHNLTEKKIEILQKYGVNRLSIGIQTFSDEGRKFYNRTFSKKQVIEKLKNLKERFKGEVCVDIIYNYPNQKLEDVIEDAKIIKTLDLGSSSFYSLMIHNGSDLSKKIDSNLLEFSEDLEKERKLHDLFVKELTQDGDYYLLELTKIAKKNRDKYQYIKVRNGGGDTFPIGVGAGGSVNNIGVFRMNKNTSIFIEKSEKQERLDKITALFQFPIIDKKRVYSLLEEREKESFDTLMQKFETKNLIKISNSVYNLTDNGIFWGNNIAREIFNTLLEVV